MRIISGTYKGRRLHPPASLPVRPTTDFAREGLFNVLNRLVDYESVSVLDLFSGTGAVAMEFCSRGAPQVLAVDIERSCTEHIRQTAAQFGMSGIKVLRSNVFVLLKRCPEPFDVIFADPPYEMDGIGKLPDLIFRSGILSPGGLFVLEHSDRYRFANEPFFLESRNYGRVHFSFFRTGEQQSGT